MTETSRYRVVLLEDDEQEAEYLQGLLRRDDIDVTRTSTVRETIETLRGRHASLVIMDVMLGRENSLDVFDYIIKSGSGTRTIVISQHAYRLDTMKRLLQADEVFSKPINYTSFVAAIDRLLPLPESVTNRNTKGGLFDRMHTAVPQYDVALSFAGEDRNYASQVAEEVRKRGLSIFYDEYEKVSLWGKDLYQHLDNVYRVQAAFTVIFVSENYRSKNWTRHELRSAQARAFGENREYILPVRLDDTEIPGLPSTTGFVDGSRTTPSELAALISEKLEIYKKQG